MAFQDWKRQRKNDNQKESYDPAKRKVKYQKEKDLR